MDAARAGLVTEALSAGLDGTLVRTEAIRWLWRQTAGAGPRPGAHRPFSRRVEKGRKRPAVLGGDSRRHGNQEHEAQYKRGCGML